MLKDSSLHSILLYDRYGGKVKLLKNKEPNFCEENLFNAVQRIMTFFNECNYMFL